MSFQTIDPVRRLEMELGQARITNHSLAIYVTAAQEYWGPFPPALDKRLELLVHAKLHKRPMPDLEAVLKDVRAVVQNFKEHDECNAATSPST